MDSTQSNLIYVGWVGSSKKIPSTRPMHTFSSHHKQ